MRQATIASRSLRRRCPNCATWGESFWTWELLDRRRSRSNLALRWLGLLIAALAAVVVVVAARERRAPPPPGEEIVWLDAAAPGLVPDPASPASGPPEAAPPTVAPMEAVAPSVVEPERQADPETPADPEALAAPSTPEPVQAPIGSDAGATRAQSPGGTGENAAAGPSALGDTPAGSGGGGAAGLQPLALASIPGSSHPVVPRYPPRAEALGIEAEVVAIVTMDTLGHVVAFRIERSGGRDFDESVRRAVLATRFQVPVREGRPRAAAFRMPYSFRLD